MTDHLTLDRLGALVDDLGSVPFEALAMRFVKETALGMPRTDGRADSVQLAEQIHVRGDSIGLWETPGAIEVIAVMLERIEEPDAADNLRLHEQIARKPPEYARTARAIRRQRQRLLHDDGMTLGRGLSKATELAVNSLASRFSAEPNGYSILFTRGAATEMLEKHARAHGVTLPVARKHWRLAQVWLLDRGKLPYRGRLADPNGPLSHDLDAREKERQKLARYVAMVESWRPPSRRSRLDNE